MFFVLRQGKPDSVTLQLNRACEHDHGSNVVLCLCLLGFKILVPGCCKYGLVDWAVVLSKSPGIQWHGRRELDQWHLVSKRGRGGCPINENDVTNCEACSCLKGWRLGGV